MNLPLSFDKSLHQFFPQTFTFPSNLIYYISKNPSSFKAYQKLIQTCKYFYLQKRIIVINKLESSVNPYIWEAYERISGKEYIKLDSRNLIFDLWLVGEFNVCHQISSGSVNLLLQKVIKCEITSLYLNNYLIDYSEFMMLTESKKITHLALEEIIVEDENGKVMPFEDILQRVPNVSYFANNIDDNVDLVYTTETAANMAQLPPYLNLKHLHILQISEYFNPNDFCDFVTKNSSDVDYLITFHDSVPLEHKKWFKHTVDKMLNSWDKEKEKPSISVSLLF